MADKIAIASQPEPAGAARDLLARGNAVDAAIAGVAAAAAATPTVLLGPLQLLVGGIGSGLLAFDGRSRQPGRGAPRPRGFLADEVIPETARVAAPLLPATLATVSASLGSVSLRRALRPALEIARAKSAERAAVLDAFSRRGAPTLVEGFAASELLAIAGRATRGLLTADDLRAMRPRMVRCPDRSHSPVGLVTVPWIADAEGDGSFTHVVAAMDARGMVAVACYEAPSDGVDIGALGLAAPKGAAPVMRGKPRIAPGTPRPVAAPIALRMSQGSVDLAVGIAASADAQSELAALLEELVEKDPNVAAVVGAVAHGQTVALLRSGETIRAIAP